MINILYTILVQGCATEDSTTQGSAEQYKKITTDTFIITNKMSDIINCIFAAYQVSATKDSEAQDSTSKQCAKHVFAAVICYYSRFSLFGNEIYELDKYNTYVEPERLDTDYQKTMKADTDECIISTYKGTCSASSIQHIKRYLDMDIVDRLENPTWLDMVSAGCLQLLREVM